MAVPLLGPKARFFDANGNPLSGGKVQTYVAGTITPLATYTDSSGTVPNTNPVILDSAGQANIWLGQGTYKIVLSNANDVIQWSVDNYAGDTANGFAGAVFPVSSNTNITDTYDQSVIVATGTISLNLEPAATAGAGFAISIYNAGTGIVTIDPSAAELINGAATMLLLPGESILVVCDGTQWYGLFKRIVPATSAKTTTYTVTAADQGSLIEVNASTATKDLIINLPAVASVPNGFTVTVKKTDADQTLSATLVSNAFASSNGTTTVTVTDTSGFVANLNVGDVVTFSGATTFGGIPAAELNGPKFILSIPTSTTYTFASVTPASSTATGGGAAINRSAVINNTVTLDPNGAETIDNAASYSLNTQYQSVTVVSDGVGWAVSVPKVPVVTGQLSYNNLFHVQDQKTSGTAGGASTAGVTAARTLNTIVVNNIPNASLTNNQVTLPPGTYVFDGSAPGFQQTAGFKVRLFNVTTSSYVAEGTSEQCITDGMQTRSFIFYPITISTTSVFEFRQYSSTTRASVGLGQFVSQGIEVYADLRIWKVI